jgi:hypothetical protein
MRERSIRVDYQLLLANPNEMPEGQEWLLIKHAGGWLLVVSSSVAVVRIASIVAVATGVAA